VLRPSKGIEAGASGNRSTARTASACSVSFVDFASETNTPRLDSRYQDNDLGQSFRKLMDAIRQVLSMVLEQHAVDLLLQQRQYGIQVSPPAGSQLARQMPLRARRQRRLRFEELRAPAFALEKSVPLAHRRLVTCILPATKVKPLPVAPAAIPLPLGQDYFALELSSESWVATERSGGFAFHVSVSYAGLSLEILGYQELTS